MYKDAMLSWFIYTFGTLAFFVMGAAVLQPQGLVPEGDAMITTLSRMYTDAIGEWANVLLLNGGQRHDKHSSHQQHPEQRLQQVPL
jgi:hypothetical protein